MLEARKRSNSYSPEIERKRSQKTRFHEHEDVIRSTELIKEKKIEEEQSENSSRGKKSQSPSRKNNPLRNSKDKSETDEDESVNLSEEEMKIS